MYLRWDDTHKREAYTCERWPECRASMGAHQRTGKPMGVPGNYNTRQSRMAAHRMFDALWRPKGAPMERKAAYDWMQQAMGLDDRTGHISMMDSEQCVKLIALCEQRLLGEWRAELEERTDGGD